MRKVKGLMCVGVAVLLAACTATPPKPKGPDLSGNWILTTETPMGSQDSDMVVQQNGEELTGTITSPMGSIDYKGKITGGKDVAFGFTFDAQGMTLQIDFTGELKDNDTIQGTAKLGDFGEGNFTAKRKTT
ncbi:MAG TPA: hypothetical protein VIL28_02765 [Steroidobacteraceae bacterium]